jgi:hypothetical protein
VVVACLALASRLDPGLFSSATQTESFLPGAHGRLNFPLNYWNALGALVALGLPLLLSIAGSARTIMAQALAAAAIPVMALCGYLTFSRGAAIAGAAAVTVFFALAPERIPKLATAVLTAAGSAVLIAGATHRSAIEHGLVNAAARHQGRTLFVWIIVVCAGVALTQAGIGLAARHGTLPALLRISPARARALLAAAVVVGVVAAVLAGVPGRLSHDWSSFKNPHSTALRQDSLGRFGVVSGNGRYDYWRVAVKSAGSHLLGGSGPGTFQLLWLPRAPYLSYIQNAHSLYFETLAELGIVGLLLLLSFFGLMLVTAVKLVARLRHEARTRAAGLAAALVAFMVTAAFDWVWQVPALVAAFLLLCGALLAPQRRASAAAPRASYSPPILLRAGTVVLALACLVAIALPLATTNAVRASQAAAQAGDTGGALADARSAVRLESGAASAQIQLALVQELRGDYRDALAAARHALADEPANWSNWLIDSRLEAESGNPGAALTAYRRARVLNPRSPLFRT